MPDRPAAAVTGAGSVNGKAIAESLLAEGAGVAVLGIVPSGFVSGPPANRRDRHGHPHAREYATLDRGGRGSPALGSFVMAWRIISRVAASPSADQLAPLDVMTFNLRYASMKTPHSWAERRPVMRQLLRRASPHLICTQEGLYRQLRDIEKDLGAGYGWIGAGRDGGLRGEFVAIFYDKDRLIPVEHGHFWLSQTPGKAGSKDEVGPESEHAGSPRMATWVRFGVRDTRRMFYALNTHLDNRSESARRRAATQLASFLAGHLDPELPRIVTGDFNVPAAAGTSVYDTMLAEGKLVDSWDRALNRGELYRTWHGYQEPVPGGPRIDWILTSPEVITTYAAINTYGDQGQYPSDHLPVQAVIVLPPPGPLS